MISTFDPKVFSEMFNTLSALELALQGATAESAKRVQAEIVYNAKATSVEDYLSSHRPVLDLWSPTERPGGGIVEVAITSPGFGELENGGKMLANALVLLHYMVRESESGDLVGTKSMVEKGRLVKMITATNPFYSPSYGGADDSVFVPDGQSAKLVASGPYPLRAIRNAEGLANILGCAYTYHNPPFGALM